MIKVMKESKGRIDLPEDIAEFIYSRQPDRDGDDYEFENAIEKCERFVDLSDDAFEDQDALERELEGVSEKNLLSLAKELGVYEAVDKDDLAMYADRLKSSDDLILVMKLNGFKDIEQKGNKIYYSQGRNGEREYIDAPEWR